MTAGRTIWPRMLTMIAIAQAGDDQETAERYLQRLGNGIPAGITDAELRELGRSDPGKQRRKRRRRTTGVGAKTTDSPPGTHAALAPFTDHEADEILDAEAIYRHLSGPESIAVSRARETPDPTGSRTPFWLHEAAQRPGRSHCQRPARRVDPDRHAHRRRQVALLSTAGADAAARNAGHQPAHRADEGSGRQPARSRPPEGHLHQQLADRRGTRSAHARHRRWASTN